MVKEKGGEERRYLRKEVEVLWKLVEGMKNSKRKFFAAFYLADRASNDVTRPLFFFFSMPMFYFGLVAKLV